jgi:quinol monooxygenase YgiN
MFVQIVHFKLKTDSSREEFLELTEQLIVWLKSKTGFVAYELYEGIEFWSDRIAWKEENLAQNGMKDFMTTDLAKKLIHLVQDGYSSFWGKSVTTAQL